MLVINNAISPPMRISNPDKQINEKLQRISQIYKLPHILSDESIIVNASTNLDTYQNLIVPKYAINFNPNKIIDESQEEYLEASFDKMSSDAVVLGHCIINNGGIPINNLSKIPSYQWGFKHEDESSSTSDLSNNGLGNFNGNSISSLPGNVTTINSTGLNSRMIRLPILNKHINKFDMHNQRLTSSGNVQGGEVRSLMNGLPYYNYQLIEQQIRSMNLHKKVSFKASNTNTSWFSDSLNKTIDDVEYLHGEVILNQFTNNKRVVRNYQWRHYWDKLLHGKKLDYDLHREHTMTLKKFIEMVKLRSDKFDRLNSQKQELMKELNELQKMDGVDGASNHDVHIKVKQIKEQLVLLPDTEEELDIFEFDDARELAEPVSDASSLRFGRNAEYNESKQFIYEKEYDLDDQELLQLQIELNGTIKAKKMQSDASTTYGKIKSKIVKIKRTPNPNALGFSNIKYRKPSYL